MKKICCFTGTRAEYGLLKPLLDEIKHEKKIKLQLLVSGSHLSPEFGLTYREIEKDGFHINEKVEVLLSSDTTGSVSKSIALGIMGYTDALRKLRPDIVVILGDRYEAFACAVAATVIGIAIAHVSGGETTLGSIDEVFRHSITKMSSLHFTSTEEYRKRVIQLGEVPVRVFAVGALGIDNIKKLDSCTRKQLEDKLRFKFLAHNLIVTFHPVTAEKDTAQYQFGNLLKALETLKETLVIFTKANADAGGRIINGMIDKFVRENHLTSVAFTSLGRLNYLSSLRYVDAVVGNSSSGIVEAPSFKIGTINIGDRQKGRIKATSIIDCEPTTKSIKEAFDILYSSQFQKKLCHVVNPHGEGNSAKKIKNLLNKFTGKTSAKKAFYDLHLSL